MDMKKGECENKMRLLLLPSQLHFPIPQDSLHVTMLTANCSLHQETKLTLHEFYGSTKDHERKKMTVEKKTLPVTLKIFLSNDFRS